MGFVKLTMGSYMGLVMLTMGCLLLKGLNGHQAPAPPPTSLYSPRWFKPALWVNWPSCTRRVNGFIKSKGEVPQNYPSMGIWILALLVYPKGITIENMRNRVTESGPSPPQTSLVLWPLIFPWKFVVVFFLKNKIK